MPKPVDRKGKTSFSQRKPAALFFFPLLLISYTACSHLLYFFFILFWDFDQQLAAGASCFNCDSKEADWKWNAKANRKRFLLDLSKDEHDERTSLAVQLSRFRLKCPTGGEKPMKDKGALHLNKFHVS